MEKIQPYLEWLKHNSPWLVPVAAGVLANLYNGLSEYPKQRAFVRWLIDVLSFVTKKDSANSLKMPFSSSKAPAGKSHMLAKRPKQPPAPPVAALLLPFLLIGMTSCACWTPEHRNDKGCAVLHQIIDCTTDVIKDLAPSVVGIITNSINGNSSPDWDGLLQRLEGMGIKDGGCILAQLENDFITKPGASPEHMLKAKQVSSMLEKFKEHKQLKDVKYCFMPKGATAKVCR